MREDLRTVTSPSGLSVSELFRLVPVLCPAGVFAESSASGSPAGQSIHRGVLTLVNFIEKKVDDIIVKAIFA